jgi:hypothetical protein
MRKRFAAWFEEVLQSTPAKAEVDADGLADHLTIVVEGAIITAKALKDPGLMGRQVRLFRQHVKLLFGA